MRLTRRGVIACVVAIAIVAAAAAALVPQLSPALDMRVFRAAAPLSRAYLVANNTPYRRVGEWTGRVDIYRPDGDGPFPVVVYFHGGGWAAGNYKQVEAWALPFLATGHAVMTASYRLADVALAPAAVQDARCALAWLGAHAADYRLDASRIATAGTSAGGHLALMAGLVNGANEFDAVCDEPPVRVKAILNYAGITDVAALLRDQLRLRPNWPFVIDWVGQGADRFALAERLSPLHWIDPSDPPVLTVHGTADDTVPYAQAIALHDALDRARVDNELMTLKNRGHTDLSIRDLAHVARRMQAFVDPKLRSAIVPITYGNEWIGDRPALPYNAIKTGFGTRAFS